MAEAANIIFVGNFRNLSFVNNLLMDQRKWSFFTTNEKMVDSLRIDNRNVRMAKSSGLRMAKSSGLGSTLEIIYS